MLVLSRKRYESIRIGKDVLVTVVSIDSHVVQLGIEAPRELTIMRTELEHRKKKGRRTAGRD
jgi:carbon storage regulator